MIVQDFNRTITAPDGFAAYAKDTLVIDFKKITDMYNAVNGVRDQINAMNLRFREIEKTLNKEIAAFVALREEAEEKAGRPWYKRWFYVTPKQPNPVQCND